MFTPVVLVTGALTGIGRAAALAFTREGAKVVASGRRAEEGKRALLRSLPLAIALFGVAQAGEPKTIKGLKNPESAAVGPDGKVFVTVIGERAKKGDGSVAVVEPSGRITTFATGLDDPHGVVIVGDSLYIADVKVVWKVDAKGKVEVFLGPEGFPRAPGYLNDIAYDGKGNFYVSDSGDRAGK